ncbi:MAG TPA: hypothetical protein VLB82_04905, partial [Thermodesulfobacteriota bacterium]|nr:hypothetical protein [Thermodesulfobacteriota bacterium]
AIAIFADDIGIDALISKASDNSNAQHLDYQLEIFKKENSIEEPVEFDYVTYKPSSVILEESQQLLFAKKLADEGYKVIINERPSVIESVRAQYGDIFEYRSKTK